MGTPEFWQRRGMLALLLAPLGWLYGASVAWKARSAKPYRAAVPVICVGNLTAGGSGKTPIALEIGARLRARGRNVFFLTRGYGGSEAGPLLVTATHMVTEIGDEALLLRQTAPTIIAHDRAAGARLAAAQGADIIVMDDGHQNFSLAKTLSIVVVDGQAGFGNGLMIPAGPLRESVRSGLIRADAVLVMGDGAPNLSGFNGPVFAARLQTEATNFSGKRVFAFAGIGRPEKFLTSLRQTGAIVTGHRFFADHHPFRNDEIAALRSEAQGALLVTTAKDFVRLSETDRAEIAILPVRAVFDDEAAFTALLDRLVAPV